MYLGRLTFITVSFQTICWFHLSKPIVSPAVGYGPEPVPSTSYPRNFFFQSSISCHILRFPRGFSTTFLYAFLVFHILVACGTHHNLDSTFITVLGDLIKFYGSWFCKTFSCSLTTSLLHLSSALPLQTH